jgi:hypothetical protein
VTDIGTYALTFNNMVKNYCSKTFYSTGPWRGM